MRLRRGDGLAAVGVHGHGVGARAERADDDAVAVRMGAEQAVRIAELAGDQLVGGAHAIGSSSSRAIPATGMRTQSGRLLSS